MFEIGAGLRGGAEVGLADDLQQRHAGAVEIDQARVATAASWMCLPASSSMWMRVMPTRFGAPSSSIVDVAVRRRRQLVLADLIALGQVGIEVVLAREDG